MQSESWWQTAPESPGRIDAAPLGGGGSSLTTPPPQLSNNSNEVSPTTFMVPSLIVPRCSEDPAIATKFTASNVTQVREAL